MRAVTMNDGVLGTSIVNFSSAAMSGVTLPSAPVEALALWPLARERLARAREKNV